MLLLRCLTLSVATAPLAAAFLPPARRFLVRLASVLALGGASASVVPHATFAQGLGGTPRQAYPIPDNGLSQVGTPTPLPVSPAANTSSDPGRNLRYRLGPGDRVTMSVFKVEGYEAEVEVLSDGTINLPRLNSVPVAGLTLDQAQRRITQLYARYLRRPLVYLDLIEPRPIRVTVVGEVQKPGYYSIAQESRQSNLQNVGAQQTTVLSSGWPTLVDAVQLAGGITATADLSSVILTRQEGAMAAQGIYRFDFLATLLGRARTVNPLLMDGDTIEVSKIDGVVPNEILIKAGKSNLSADAIAVTVVGEVIAPGLKQVRSNSSLTEAVMAAGDLNQLRADANFIRLLRMQSDGTVLSSRLRFDPAASLGSPNNPALQNGDVIVVARNGWTSLNERLSQAVEPLGPLLNAASLYNILSTGP